MNPMTQPGTREAFERLVRKVDPSSRLLKVWDLKGGVSAQVMALEIERSDGTTRRVVVRRHGAANLKNNPDAAADEFRLLQVLHAEGLAIPAPIHVDRSGDSFSSPCVVIEYVDGTSEFAPAHLPAFIRQLAAILARIHAVDISTVSFLPAQEGPAAGELWARLRAMDASLDTERLGKALASAASGYPRHTPVLLHGDFWPGNILWKNGRLAAIIDWEDAKVGDLLSDISGTRLELLWAFGAGAMEQFTRDYASLTNIDIDAAGLSYWDLFVALGPAAHYATWTDDNATAHRMREGRRRFITGAIERLTNIGD